MNLISCMECVLTAGVRVFGGPSFPNMGDFLLILFIKLEDLSGIGQDRSQNNEKKKLARNRVAYESGSQKKKN